MKSFEDTLIEAFDRKVQALTRHSFGTCGDDIIRETMRVWESEVAKTYNVRESMGLDVSHQLRKCLRGKVVKSPQGNKIVFWMEPIYHTYHSRVYNTMVTVDYGRFIKEGIKPSMQGRYDPCVDRKLDIFSGGMHPGVPRSKFWGPMIARIRARTITFMRGRYISEVRKNVRGYTKTGTTKINLKVRIGGR